MITVSNLTKNFVLHNQNSAVIPVMVKASLDVKAGECVALIGQSGAGKSTLMRMIYGNYLAQDGDIWIGKTNVVGARDVVAEPLMALGVDPSIARQRAENILSLLNIPERLWNLSPTTFSGGEQQRVNIARGFVYEYPAILLDEPTASLDAVNRSVVLELIERAKSRGAAIVGIFHDESARAQVCDREIDVSAFAPQMN
jgi:alpha-D-ribose 1-methylphosphonate 5-triphosphate synthase subunit PhnL